MRADPNRLREERDQLARHCAGLEQLVQTYAAVINELATENEALRDQPSFGATVGGESSFVVERAPRTLGDDWRIADGGAWDGMAGGDPGVTEPDRR